MERCWKGRPQLTAPAAKHVVQSSMAHAAGGYLSAHLCPFVWVWLRESERMNEEINLLLHTHTHRLRVQCFDLGWRWTRIWTDSKVCCWWQSVPSLECSSSGARAPLIRGPSSGFFHHISHSNTLICFSRKSWICSILEYLLVLGRSAASRLYIAGIPALLLSFNLIWPRFQRSSPGWIWHQWHFTSSTRSVAADDVLWKTTAPIRPNS